MADPVAGVERIVKLGLAIKEAADTVRRNEEVCREIRQRVLRFSDILWQLQQTGLMDNSPAMSGALEDLEESLQHALELVTACQERGTIRRFITAGDLAKQLRRVKDDILNKVMLASFAINVQTSIVLLTIQAGGHPLPRLQQDMGAAEMSPNILSTDDASDLQNSALREFKLSELMAATNNFSADNIIGQGGSFTVFKGDFNDGKLVAIKKLTTSNRFPSVRIYDMHLIASKLQHKNIVKVLGYAAHETEYCLVEEYAPSGSLEKIIQELQWSSLFRIIQGVAHGLHYLHRQGLIHRDVKPGNIVLDSDMNPKITDFELAIVLDDNDEIDEVVAGTIGYVDPVYMVEGIVSLKTDVYSFGVTLIETVGSIRRISKRSRPALMEWAWDAAFGLPEEEFDRSLVDESELMEIRRCVHVGLLCTQHLWEDRPTMADVIQMLNGDKELPTPKKMGFVKAKLSSYCKAAAHFKKIHQSDRSTARWERMSEPARFGGAAARRGAAAPVSQTLPQPLVSKCPRGWQNWCWNLSHTF